MNTLLVLREFVVYTIPLHHVLNFHINAHSRQTCCVDVEVSGFVGNVAHRLDPRTFGCDLGGVALSLVHVHFERALGNFLASKQHSHLQRMTQKPCFKAFYTVNKQTDSRSP